MVFAFNSWKCLIFLCFFISKLNKILKDTERTKIFTTCQRVDVFFLKGFACYSSRKSDGLLSQLRTFPSLLPSPSHWMAQDDTLAVLVWSTFLYPKLTTKNIEFHPFFLYKTWLRNRSIDPTSPGRSQGLGRGLRALWWTENRWRAKLQTQGSCCKVANPLMVLSII